MSALLLKASRDPATGQTYVPARALAADGSLRQAEPLEVPARGILYSATRFAGECYGIVDLDCGARIMALLEPGTERIGAGVIATTSSDDGQPRFRHA